MMRTLSKLSKVGRRKENPLSRISWELECLPECGILEQH